MCEFCDMQRDYRADGTTWYTASAELEHDAIECKSASIKLRAYVDSEDTHYFLDSDSTEVVEYSVGGVPGEIEVNSGVCWFGVNYCPICGRELEAI